MRTWIRQLSQRSIQTQSLSFRQQTVHVERKAFRRSVSIIVKSDEQILVRAGLRLSDQAILRFLNEKADWIDRNVEKIKEQKNRFPQKRLSELEVFPLLGRDLRLQLVPTPLKKVFFSEFENRLKMHIPMNQWGQLSTVDLQSYWPELRHFYHQQAKQLVPDRLQIWSQQMGLIPKKLTLKNQKTRWGSCSSEGNLNINWRLVAAPIEILDYVIVHELAHLRFMNHSKHFWDLVERHEPEYRVREKWLKENHESMRFLIR
jgi:predicted metal-dependent hydrolase